MGLRRFLCILVLVFSAVTAEAQYFQMDLMKQRQGNKESSRWTLADWLSQKNRISIWDQWLAMNRSANLFEMQLSGGQFDYDYTTDNGSGEVKVTESSKTYALDLWISIFGLRAEYEDRDSGFETKSGMLSLRLIGSSLQSTHFLVRGGMQVIENTNTGEKWENPFASAVLKMYFLSFIGLEGEYRHFFPKDSNLGTRREGSQIRSGAFIEYGIFKISGQYWQEPMETTSSGVVTKEKRDGYNVGVSLIF